MNLILMLSAFAVTMVQYFCLLWSLKTGVKRKYVIAMAVAVLVGIWAIGGARIGSGLEGYIGIRTAFVAILFMIDKKRILDKVETAVLIALMKDCLLLAIETWMGHLTINFVENPYYMSLYYVGEALVVFLFALVLRKVVAAFDTERIRKAGTFLDYVVFIGIFDIFTCLWWAYYEVISGRYDRFKDKVYTSFGAVALILLEVTILYKKWLTEQVEKHATAERKLYEMEKTYFLSLLDKEADTRKYRHDMNNHMICLKALMDEGDYEELGAYIGDLYESTNALVNKGHKTGNSILDALTNYYADRVEEGVEFSLVGSIYKPLALDDIALSSIYSNLLVNAMEAQREIPEGQQRFIRIELKEGAKFAQISVSNAMREERIADPGRQKTSKADAHNHGFGLENIRGNVAACHGSMSIEAEDYTFCVKVTIPVGE